MLAQDNANFFWDDATNNLSIGGSYYIGALPAFYVVPNVSGNNWFAGQAGNTGVTGANNQASGYLSLSSVTSGARNTALGALSMMSLTTGTQNFACGYSALQFNVSGSNNTAIGYGALQNTTQGDNVAVGFRALLSSSAGGNTAIGAGTAPLMTGGTDNVVIGRVAATNWVGSCTSNIWIGGYYGLPSHSYNNTIALTLGIPATEIIGMDFNLTLAQRFSFMNRTFPNGLHVYNTVDATLRRPITSAASSTGTQPPMFFASACRRVAVVRFA